MARNDQRRQRARPCAERGGGKRQPHRPEVNQPRLSIGARCRGDAERALNLVGGHRTDRWQSGQHHRRHIEHAAAAGYGMACAWDVLTVPGVAHSNAGMARAAAAIIASA